MYPKITIVTPCFNQVNYIDECIRSVIDQAYPNLEYIIIDGGSTDGTLEIIKKYASHLAYWVSEKDQGIYDALTKGFLKSSGEIMGWLNSDDMLHHKSLYTLREIFLNFKEVNWLQGYPTVMEEQGRIVHHRSHRASKFSFLLKDYHDGIFIQQESTFWRRSLWEKAGAFISTEYRYAGDFELWMRFFLHERLVVTNALLGAFRRRKEGQLSSDNYDAYLQECDLIIDRNLSLLNNVDRRTLNRIGVIRKVKKLIPGIDQWPYIRRFLHNKLNRNWTVKFDFRSQQFYLKR